MAQQMNTKQQAASILLLVTLLITLLACNPKVADAQLEPLVDTGVSALSPEGRHVAVNVPGFFHLNMDTRGPSNGVRLTQSVMSGLVKVNLDREKGPDGKMRGPIRVSVGGMTVYDNKESPLDG